MSQSTPPCRICSSRRTGLWKQSGLERELTPDDFKITDSRYGLTLTLYRCSDCSFIFADEAEMGELTKLYEQLVDPSYEDGAENRARQMRWLLGLSIAHAGKQARTLLEIGAGSGLLVAEARRMGLEAVGVEPSQSLVATAKTANNVELLQGTFPHPELKDRKFDLVLLVDVIEHLSDPIQLLTDCAAALAPGGIFLVVTPNVSSLAAKVLRHRWWHFRLAHVGYFNGSSMERAVARAGLTIQSHRTVCWFFPIRYLAERVAVYLPIGPINRMADRIGPLRWIYDQVISLNLRDSTAFFITHKR